MILGNHSVSSVSTAHTTVSVYVMINWNLNRSIQLIVGSCQPVSKRWNMRMYQVMQDCIKSSSSWLTCKHPPCGRGVLVWWSGPVLYPDDMPCPGCVRDGYTDPLGPWSAPLINWEDPCSSEEGTGRLESDMSNRRTRITVWGWRNRTPWVRHAIHRTLINVWRRRIRTHEVHPITGRTTIIVCRGRTRPPGVHPIMGRTVIIRVGGRARVHVITTVILQDVVVGIRVFTWLCHFHVHLRWSSSACRIWTYCHFMFIGHVIQSSNFQNCFSKTSSFNRTRRAKVQMIHIHNTYRSSSVIPLTY